MDFLGLILFDGFGEFRGWCKVNLLVVCLFIQIKAVVGTC